LIREWLRNFIGESPLVDELRREIEHLKYEKSRLEDLVYQKLGLITKDVLPGMAESMSPISLTSRRQARLEAEEKYRRMAETAIEELRKKQ
jgi:hypothetical protein